METSGRIWPNFELIQALMNVLIACKYEKDQMKNSGENVMTSFSPLSVYGIFFRRSRAANSVVHGRISPNFELIQALMYSLYKKKCKHYIFFNNLSTFKDEHFKLTGYLDLYVLYQSVEIHNFPAL